MRPEVWHYCARGLDSCLTARESSPLEVAVHYREVARAVNLVHVASHTRGKVEMHDVIRCREQCAEHYGIYRPLLESFQAMEIDVEHSRHNFFAC